jgi:hypothetical protein
MCAGKRAASIAWARSQSSGGMNSSKAFMQ